MNLESYKESFSAGSATPVSSPPTPSTRSPPSGQTRASHRPIPPGTVNSQQPNLTTLTYRNPRDPRLRTTMRSSRPRMTLDTEFLPLGKPVSKNLPDLLVQQPAPLPENLLERTPVVPPLRLKIKSGKPKTTTSTPPPCITLTPPVTSISQDYLITDTPVSGPSRATPISNYEQLVQEQQVFSNQINALIAEAGCPNALQTHNQWQSQRPAFSDRLLNASPLLSDTSPLTFSLGTPSRASDSPGISSLVDTCRSIRSPAPPTHISSSSSSAGSSTPLANDLLGQAINSSITQELTLSQEGNLELGGQRIEFILSLIHI